MYTSGITRNASRGSPLQKKGPKNDITVAGNTDLSLRLQFETAIASWQCRVISLPDVVSVCRQRARHRPSYVYVC